MMPLPFPFTVYGASRSSAGSSTCADGDWVTGKVGDYALEFDGTNDYVTMGAANSTPSNALQPSVGTYACWVNMAERDTGQIFGATNPNSAAANNAGTWIGAWNRLSKQVFYANAGDGTNAKLIYNTALGGASGWSLSTWHHLAMTWVNPITAPSDLKLYVNGTFISPESDSYDGGSNFDAGASRSIREFLMGAGYRIASFSGFKGKIDDAAVWNVVLDSGAVSALYNSGDGAAANTVSSSNIIAYYNMEAGAGNDTLTDRGSNGYNGTLTNMDTGSCS
tara:strand:- start:1643 stop:2479 length:837 start_codon:yes stop_codon:yes gene_type:complete